MVGYVGRDVTQERESDIKLKVAERIANVLGRVRCNVVHGPLSQSSVAFGYNSITHGRIQFHETTGEKVFPQRFVCESNLTLPTSGIFSELDEAPGALEQEFLHSQEVDLGAIPYTTG